MPGKSEPKIFSQMLVFHGDSSHGIESVKNHLVGPLQKKSKCSSCCCCFGASENVHSYSCSSLEAFLFAPGVSWASTWGVDVFLFHLVLNLWDVLVAFVMMFALVMFFLVWCLLLPEGLPCLQLIWRFPASYTRNHWHCSIPFGSQVTGGARSNIIPDPSNGWSSLSQFLHKTSVPSTKITTAFRVISSHQPLTISGQIFPIIAESEWSGHF